jgi:hypothetical protein
MNTRSWIGFIDKETESALTLLYSYMAFYETISDKEMAKKANEIPQFWMAHTGAIQHTLFLYLGRLSDDSPDAKSFTDFRNHIFQHLDDFREESFLERRAEALELNPEFLDDKQFPKDAEFSELFKLASEPNKYLREECKAIRSKVFAHAILTEEHEYFHLFEKVDLNTIENALLTMWSINQHLWNCHQNVRALEPKILECGLKEQILEQTRRAIAGAI